MCGLQIWKSLKESQTGCFSSWAYKSDYFVFPPLMINPVSIFHILSDRTLRPDIIFVWNLTIVISVNHHSWFIWCWYFWNAIVICVHWSLGIVSSADCSLNCLFQRSLTCRRPCLCSTVSPHTFFNHKKIHRLTLGLFHLLGMGWLMKPQTKSLAAEIAPITEAGGKVIWE